MTEAYDGGHEYCGVSKVLVEPGSRDDNDEIVRMMVSRKLDRKCGAKRLAFKCDKGLRSLEPVEKANKELPRKDKDESFATQVLPWLFLGGAVDANKEACIRSHKITHIVNMTQETPGLIQYDFVQYLNITVRDHSDEPIGDFFGEIIEWLEEVRKAQGVALVHCKQGISRSATITIAYLMQICKLPYLVVHEVVQIKRPIINPNLGFVAALQQHQKNLEIPPDVPMQYVRQTLSQYQLTAEGESVRTPSSPRTAPPFSSIGFS